MELFSEDEGLEFIKRSLEIELKHTEIEIKELCRLLDNIPLALNLAVSAVNNRKIDLQNYIEKISLKDAESISDDKSKDYEKTINKAINISVDLILKEKGGKFGYKILNIFGYIQPNDVNSKFFIRVTNCCMENLTEAIELLEKYSLITKTGKVYDFPYDDGIFNKWFGRDQIILEMDVLSIHPLLQEVIRSNGRKTEKETLKKILRCKGFMEYKLFTLMQHGDEKLKKEFPNVKSESVDLEKKRKGKRVQGKVLCAQKKIELMNCSLLLSSFDRLSPKELILRNISFIRDERVVGMVTVNEFVDLNKINRLTLICDKKNMSIDFCNDVYMEYVQLRNIKVLNWKEAKWTVHTLVLYWIPFVEKTKMNIQEIEILQSSLEISCLPKTIQKLTLYGRFTKVYCSEGLQLPDLKYLELKYMSNSYCLRHFRTLQLTHIHFYDVKVNLNLLPKSVKKIKITKNPAFFNSIDGGIRKLDKLILEGFSFQEIKEFLAHFHTDTLVLHNQYQINSLIELMNKGIRKIIIGPIKWGPENLHTLSCQIDKKAEFYLIEGGRGIGIETEDFVQLVKLK